MRKFIFRSGINIRKYSGNNNQTHFGFKNVQVDEKEKLVHDVFEKVASTYDKMNDAMSLGIHRLWKDHLINTISPAPNTSLLDVAGGTGDIAFRFLNKVDPTNSGKTAAHVHVVDINSNMLDVGIQRSRRLNYSDSNIKFSVCNAEDLSIIDSSSVDCYTIAFGIRNCTNIDKVLSEAYR